MATREETFTLLCTVAWAADFCSYQLSMLQVLFDASKVVRPSHARTIGRRVPALTDVVMRYP